jgi:hypothetical protein
MNSDRRDFRSSRNRRAGGAAAGRIGRPCSLSSASDPSAASLVIK